LSVVAASRLATLSARSRTSRRLQLERASSFSRRRSAPTSSWAKLAQENDQLVIRFDGLRPIIPSTIPVGSGFELFSYMTLRRSTTPIQFRRRKIPYRAATDP
jgi:hypothetical protein